MADTSTPPPPADLVAALRTLLVEVAGTAPAELYDLAGTLAFTCQSKSSVYRGISANTFPHPVDTPSGKRWRRRDLLRWVEKLRS